MCIKEKQNNSSQSFLRNPSTLKLPLAHVWTQSKFTDSLEAGEVLHQLTFCHVYEDLPGIKVGQTQILTTESICQNQGSFFAREIFFDPAWKAM